MRKVINYLNLVYFVDKVMVLKYYLDKRKVVGELIKEGDNDYFICIIKGKKIS